MDVLACTGLLLSLVCIASPLHSKIRQLFKPSLVTVTIKQLPVVALTQAYANRLLDVAVLLSAATITLEVYLTLIPLLVWSGKAHEVVTGLLPQLALSGYVVFAIKDLLESPRPGDCLKAAPHVELTVRDPSGDIEDGIPSAHCCGAVSLLYYGIHAASVAGLLTDQQKTLAQVAAAAWVIWLAWGRAYLGLHSPLDLATGSLLGFALLRLWLNVDQPYIAWLDVTMQQQPWMLPVQVLGVSAVLMRCYPMPSRWTSCYNYATAWQAGWAGVTVGWGVLQQGQLVTSSSPEWLFGGTVPPLACKIFLGLGMVAASKVVVKAVLVVVLKQLFAVVPLSVRCLWQPPVVGAVRQPSPQQQSAQRLAGYASAVVADFTHHHDEDHKSDAAAGIGSKQVDSSTSTAAACVASSLGSTAAAHSSSSSSSSRSGSGKYAGSGWGGLRHTQDGVGNDVVATARWFSYFAVGLTVSLWLAVWPMLQQWLAPSISVS